MTEGGGSSTARQRQLWRLGVALAEAQLEDRDAALENAMKQLGKVLNIPVAGVWETDVTTRQTSPVLVWSKPGTPASVHDPRARTTSDAVIAEMFENEGVAVVTMDELSDERDMPSEWENGRTVLSIIDFFGGKALTLAVATPESTVSDEDLQFIRIFATALRSFLSRLRVERDLQTRLDLGQLVVDAVARLGTASAETAPAIVESVLVDVGAQFDCDTVRVYQVKSDRMTVRHHAGDLLDPVWNVLPRTLHSPVRTDGEPTLTRLSRLAHAFFDTTDGIELHDDPAVAAFAAEAGTSWREIIVCIGNERTWTTAEREAVAAVVYAIVQLDARLDAERWSAYRHAVQAEFSRIASRFLQASEHDVDEFIEEALQRVARQLEAPVAMICDFDEADIETGDELGTVTSLWSEEGVPFPIGEPVRFPQRWTPAHSGAPKTAVFPITESLNPTFQALMGSDDQRRFSVVSVPVVGTEGDRAALGLALPGNNEARFPMLIELLATFADLISQLRVRLGLEAEKRRRQASERFLHDVAVTLAEAAEDDFDDAVASVLVSVGDSLELDSLQVLRCDPDDQQYVARYRWGAATTAPDEVAFGAIDIADDARCAGDKVIRHHRTDDEVTSTVALYRDHEAHPSIMLAERRASSSLSAGACRILDEVNQLLGQVELRIDDERYTKTAFGDAPIGIVMTDARWRVVTCNPAFATFLGFDDPADMIGLGPNDLLDSDERHPDGGTQDIPMRRRDGQRVWATAHSTRIQAASSGDPMWLIHIEDITERRRAEQLLRFQATHDELTGLANRRRLLAVCEERLDGPESTAIILLDIDRFKLINDSLGHDRGDELLIVVADRLRLSIRPGDTVARLGGDEFAIVLAGPTDVYEAGRVADRLLRLLGEPVQLGTQTIFPSASLGIAVADDTTTVSDLMRRADTAMYRAKARGRGRHEAFDEDLRGEVQTRMETEAGLRQALRNDELVVHYQPEIDLHTGKVLGAEALVRWEHPEQGLLYPGAFIEVAEETGLIVDLGIQVLFAACHSAASWPDRNLMVRVNFAAAQLQRDETVGLVAKALHESGLEPHRLCVEITESAMMADVEQAERVLADLKALGVYLAVDDFGTGFSSLAYLKRFPVDALKIDREFVMVLGPDNKDTAFVQSIISLADALGLSVVAEGIETIEQADMLLSLGCRRAQGFYFAKPAPVDQLLELVSGQVTS